MLGLMPGTCVNLPRWGLKLCFAARETIISVCKFTPLGFETTDAGLVDIEYGKCKFTPLGFETSSRCVLFKQP